MMQTAAIFDWLRHFSPLRLAGPLSDKELRVASRRARSYMLRSGYVLLLCVLVLSSWYSMVGIQRVKTTAFGVSRAAEMATYLTSTIIWFQFATAQFIAAMVLSFSMSDELRRGTLSTLMTTPIRSVHIVAGKLLGGLLQVVLLLAIGLPVLAILRVQGGVQWSSVAAGFCVTVTAALFAAALSLFLSMHYRHPYQAMSAAAVVYFVAFLILPAALTMLTSVGVLSQSLSQLLIDLTNPFRALHGAVPLRGVVTVGGFPWPIHCIALSGVTLLLLGLCVWRVRPAAAGRLPARIEAKSRPIARLYGSPLVWKDTAGRLLPWRRADMAIAVVALVACGLIIAIHSPRTGSYGFYLHYFTWGLWLLALVRLAISVAGGITREKEGGTWPLLLTSPLDSNQIIRAKAVAALRQNAILLLSAFAVQCSLLFSTVGRVNVFYMAFSVVSMVATIFFIVSAGLYFGVRLRTTTVAAAATLGTHLCLNFVVSRLLITFLFRLLWHPIARTGGSSIRMALLSFAPSSGMLILNLLLARFLLRRARRNVRQYVF